MGITSLWSRRLISSQGRFCSDNELLSRRPSSQESGHGGMFQLPTTNITAIGGEFGSIAPGAPAFGQDATNKNLCMFKRILFNAFHARLSKSLLTLEGYFNATPAACAVFGLDVIAPMHFGKPANESVDLIVSGPNEGQNNGPFLYTISGTIGAAYAAVERGVSPNFSRATSQFSMPNPTRDSSLPWPSRLETAPIARSRLTLACQMILQISLPK